MSTDSFCAPLRTHFLLNLLSCPLLRGCSLLVLTLLSRSSQHASPRRWLQASKTCYTHLIIDFACQCICIVWSLCKCWIRRSIEVEAKSWSNRALPGCEPFWKAITVGHVFNHSHLVHTFWLESVDENGKVHLFEQQKCQEAWYLTNSHQWLLHVFINSFCVT